MTRRPATPIEPDGDTPKGFDDFELTLGDIMRGERATMGKSLLDVQRELKIKASYIAAIENADPTAFETPGFIAGYVRSYARYLGLDAEWAYKTFCEEGGFTNPHGMTSAASGGLARKKEPRRASSDPIANPNISFTPKDAPRLSQVEPRAVGSIAVLMCLVGLIGYGGWSVLQEVQRVQFTPVEETPGVISQIDPLEPSVAIAAAETGESDIVPPTTEAFDRLYRPQALDVPVLASRDGPIAAIDPRSNGALAPTGEDQAPEIATAPSLAPVAVTEQVAETTEAGDAPAVQVVEADLPDVVLFAVRPSWVRVRAADGTVLFEKILDAGERFELPKTEEPPTLRAGNAGSLYFLVNGETYGPAGQGPSVVRNVALAPDLLTESYGVANIDEDEDLARFVAVAEATETPVAADQ